LAERLGGWASPRPCRRAGLLDSAVGGDRSNGSAGCFTVRPDGRVAVDVLQTVRGLDGALLGEADVVRVYVFRDGLIARMDIEE
jgi:hypothetical protein